MAYSSTSEAIEALAVEIGENIYLDIAKWHLYLGDAKLHTPLAEQLYPLLKNKSLSESAVTDVLKSFKVEIGGGRGQVSLLDVMPISGQRDLMRLLEDYQDSL